MAKVSINKSAIAFLKQLKNNNNREWFAANKEMYLAELNNIQDFATDLLSEMNKQDVIETDNGKKSVHRIYRDIRFSKDKTPYNSYWSGSYKRASKLRRGSYYFHIEPGNNFVAGGFWGPEPNDLKKIRTEFDYNPKKIRKILNAKPIIETFSGLKGEQIKTTPKGFDANSDAIDLLRYKQFLLIKSFSDKEVLNTDFVKVASATFNKMRPFLDYMTDILTTDLNGITNI